MPLSAQAVHNHLLRLSQRRSLDGALGLFDALGYEYAAELPLPTRTWPDGVRQLVSDSAKAPIYLARHRGFYVIYTHLTTEGLSRTVERPIVEQTRHKLNPYALFLFANRDLTLWAFVNVKYSARRRPSAHYPPHPRRAGRTTGMMEPTTSGGKQNDHILR